MRFPFRRSVSRSVSRPAFVGYQPQDDASFFAQRLMTPLTGLARIRHRITVFDLSVTNLRRWTCAVVVDGEVYHNTAVTYVEKVETLDQARLHVEFAPMKATRPSRAGRYYVFDENGLLIGTDECNILLRANDSFAPSYSCHT